MANSSDPRWLAGERVLDVAPRFEPRVDDPTPRRVNFVAGRALTAQALQTEQRHKDRRFALLGRALEPGIIQGLEVRAISTEAGAAEVLVSPGIGLTAAGEDVVLHRPISVGLDTIPASEPLTEEDDSPVGLVLLSLKPVRAVSALAADKEDPCPTDPDGYVYDDLVTMDGAKLVWSRLDEGEPVQLPEAPENRVRTLRPARDLRTPRLPMPDGRPIQPGLSLRRVLVPASVLLGRTQRAQSLTKLRNDVAFRLFEEEAETASRGEPARWDHHGVPLAVAQVTPAGEIIFLDRFAVARMGGAPRRATPSDTIGLPQALRRARFDQFVAHIQDLRTEGAPLAPASQHFKTLPPVGVMPATLINFDTMRSEFFPENYRVEAAPVPIEQFEAILSARSGLAPFEFGAPDYVQILVPVAEHLYEPRLLLREEVDEVFQDAIDTAAIEITQHDAVLRHLQGLETAVIGAVDVDSVSYPAPERTLSPDEDGINNYAADAAEILGDLYRSIKDLPVDSEDKEAVRPENFLAMIEAVAGAETTISADDSPRKKPVFQGLKPVIESLSRKLERANDFVDMSFVRLQADIYRARKHLVGEDDATRLATSPVLANLASNTTGVETSNLIRRFFDKTRSDKERPVPTTALQLPPQTEAPTTQTRATAQLRALPFNVAMIKMAKLGGRKAQAAAVLSPAVNASLLAKSIAAATATRATTAVGLTPQAIIGNRFASLKSDLASARLNARSISWQGLVYSKGSPVRTVTVAERLRHSPAQEAKNAAVATKAEIARGLQVTGLNLDGLQLPISGGRTILVENTQMTRLTRNQIEGVTLSANLIRLLGDRRVVPIDGNVHMINEAHVIASAPRVIANDNTIVDQARDIMDTLYGLRAGLDLEGLPGLILSDRLDPDPANPDEGGFYAAAVDALESAISMLRLVESRVHAYATFQDVAQGALLSAYDLTEKWQGAVERTEAELSEARHDHAVAIALKTEEETRIAAINARRQDILEKNVELVGFARPRTVDRFGDAPGMSLYAPFETPIPACLEGAEDPPEELEEMLEDLREAPVGWFPDLADEIGRIDKARRLRDAWERARDRAQSWLKRYRRHAERMARATRHRRVSGKAATGVRLALTASRARWAQMLRARAERPLAELGRLGWRTLRDRATSELSMEDLAGAGRAGAALAREGLDELDRIGSVASCFLDTLHTVPADIRLRWAEELSVHDEPQDLSSLQRAPGWDRIGFEDRRMLEHLHGWLFSRINRADPDARAAMSEIVRVCMLLSSHAPVSDIVEGEAQDRKLLGPGESFEVAVSRGEAGVGMIAAFSDRLRRGTGVVEDIVGTNALVRITAAPDGMIAVGPDLTIKFSKPVRRRMLRRRRR